MKLLLSNDDGVSAPGLAALASALTSLGDITVVAPDRNRSGASNSLTLDYPLRCKTLENGFISVEGTPTDCVHLALNGLFNQQHDIVVSGINAGANLGEVVFHSGTVAAAMEGRSLGLPAMAVSLAGMDYKNFTHYQTAATVAKNILLRLLAEPLPAATMLNINVPDIPLAEIAGYDITRLGKHHQAERMVAGQDPRGQELYWVGLPGKEDDAGPGTDFYAIKSRRVSITPLSFDLTHYSAFESISGWSQTL